MRALAARAAPPWEEAVMMRHILVFAVLVALLGAGPASPSFAQGTGTQQPAIPASPTTIGANSSYAQVASAAVVEAFDRTTPGLRIHRPMA